MPRDRVRNKSVPRAAMAPWRATSFWGAANGDAHNRAAEAAVPAAKPLLVRAVRDMSVEDGLKILRGGDDSVTAGQPRSTKMMTA